eukprot:scaffold222326_cov36-Cyclotella_meneghiniana.AAC.1
MITAGGNSGTQTTDRCGGYESINKQNGPETREQKHTQNGPETCEQKQSSGNGSGSNDGHSDVDTKKIDDSSGIGECVYFVWVRMTGTGLDAPKTVLARMVLDLVPYKLILAVGCRRGYVKDSNMETRRNKIGK